MKLSKYPWLIGATLLLYFLGSGPAAVEMNASFNPLDGKMSRLGQTLRTIYGPLVWANEEFPTLMTPLRWQNSLWLGCSPDDLKPRTKELN